MLLVTSHLKKCIIVVVSNPLAVGTEVYLSRLRTCQMERALQIREVVSVITDKHHSEVGGKEKVLKALSSNKVALQIQNWYQYCEVPPDSQKVGKKGSILNSGT